ncbi:branched-chain amino acid ABC transporter permease [Microbacterium deminutum]|uniref:Branched-chain amino acid ABC transporter permease n=1 Tax=Microbacterium deminutum TaxID=344164 RepID=A0ABP5BGV5_9MICO
MRSHVAHPRWRVLPILFAFALVAIALFGAALPAQAIAPTSIEVGDSCTATKTVGCLQGKVVDDNRNPVKGVTISVAGPAGTAEATTTKQGQFFFAVDTAGKYTVTLDASTLPEGVTPKAAATTVTVTLGQLTPAGFALNGHPKGSERAQSAGASNWAELLWNQIWEGVLLGLLIALAAIGLSLIYGTTGLSNFAHAEQITLGGFLAYVFAVQLGLNFVVATIIVVILSGIFGYLQDSLLWAPLRRRGLGLTQLMVVTIGLSLALDYIYALIWGPGVVKVSTGIELQTGPLRLTPSAYWSMLISIVVLVAVGLALLYTRIGRATRAVADNRPLAAASGIDVDRIIRIVWTVSAALAGLSGVLYALVNGGISFLAGAPLLLLIFAAVTLGGIGTAFGALVGSIIIGLISSLSTLWLPPDLRYGVALVILILTLLFRPQGILGRRERVG